MTPDQEEAVAREAAVQRIQAEIVRRVIVPPAAMSPDLVGAFLVAAGQVAGEAVAAAIEETHCGCCDGGPPGYEHPWDAILPKAQP